MIRRETLLGTGIEEVAALMLEMGFAADTAYITALLTKFDQNADGVLECHEFEPLFEFLRQAQAQAGEAESDAISSTVTAI